MKKIALAVCLLITVVACNSTKKDSVKKNTPKNGSAVLDSLSAVLNKNPNDVVALTKRSLEYFKKGQNTEGLSDISKAYRLDSTNTEVRLTHADYMILNNKLLEARADFDFVVATHPGKKILSRSLIGLAKTYIIPGNFDKAFEYINEALKNDKYLTEAYMMKGLIYRAGGKFDLAISSFQTAVQINPNLYEGFLSIAQIYEMQENPLALEFYQAALDIEPKGIDALYGKALYLQFHDKIQQSRQVYSEILSIDSMYYNAYYNQGWIKMVLQDEYDSAAYFFLKTLELNPNYTDAWYNLGLCDVKRKYNKEARKCFTNVLKIDPTYQQAKKELDALR